MDKIDLIIDNIMYAKIIKEGAHQDELLEEALAAARKVREMKPVAWLTTEPFAQTGISITTVTLHQQMSGTPLYALDEATK
jgi:hypothetical protein